VGGGGLGYQFNDWFRSDVRIDYSGSYNLDWPYFGHLSSVSALGNVYLDVPTGTLITPYVGAGAGYTWAKIDGDKDNAFTFDLTGGAAFDVSDNMKLDLGFRYVNVNAEGGNLNEYQGLAGVRFGF